MQCIFSYKLADEVNILYVHAGGRGHQLCMQGCVLHLTACTCMRIRFKFDDYNTYFMPTLNR